MGDDFEFFYWCGFIRARYPGLDLNLVGALAHNLAALSLMGCRP